jgi:hypothetical protein
MSDLHARLKAHIDAGLAIAKAAADDPPPWKLNDWASRPYVAHMRLHDPADALRRYAGELEVLERHPTRAMALAESAPSIAQPNLCWRCNVAYPCPEIRSLASRLGVSVDA